jgi:uncharacterized protein
LNSNEIHLGLLFIAAIVAGGVNALAGGGTFFSFPALIACGVPPLLSNATNAVCVTPGHALAAFVYKKELSLSWKRVLMCALAASVGAVGGAWLLTVTNPKVFNALVPWLLLIATVMFAAGPAIQNWSKRFISAEAAAAARSGPPTLQGNGPKAWLGYCLASIYGGYFGAGQGIVLMTVVTLTGVEDMQEANALKNAVATVVSFIAVVVLAFKGLILWGYGILMVIGALLGGYGGGKLAKVMSKKLLRGFILTIALLLTVYYFYKTYAPHA